MILKFWSQREFQEITGSREKESPNRIGSGHKETSVNGYANKLKTQKNLYLLENWEELIFIRYNNKRINTHILLRLVHIICINLHALASSNFLKRQRYRLEGSVFPHVVQMLILQPDCIHTKSEHKKFRNFWNVVLSKNWTWRSSKCHDEQSLRW